MKFELNAFNDLLQVPTVFEVVETSELAFEKLFRTWSYLTQQRHNVLLLCGGTGSTRGIAERYRTLFAAKVDSDARLRDVQAGSMEEVRAIDAFCASEDITLIVAIGGGKVIDTGKMAIKKRSAALVCIPSALSSDGITSPIAVLRNDDGKVQSFASGIPTCVLVDLSITTKAPLALTLSGIGDILSNVSALLDVDEYEAAGIGQVNGFAKLLSHSAYQMVLPLTRADILAAEGQEAVARALILSGLSMAFSGSSLPCSGGEHLISHAIDHLGIGTGTHGLQVAIATLYCLSLRDRLGLRSGASDMRTAMSNLGLPAKPEDIGIAREEFMEAVRLAPQMRTGRFTILDRKPGAGALAAAYQAAFCEAAA